MTNNEHLMKYLQTIHRHEQRVVRLQTIQEFDESYKPDKGEDMKEGSFARQQLIEAGFIKIDKFGQISRTPAGRKYTSPEPL